MGPEEVFELVDAEGRPCDDEPRGLSAEMSAIQRGAITAHCALASVCVSVCSVLCARCSTAKQRAPLGATSRRVCGPLQVERARSSLGRPDQRHFLRAAAQLSRRILRQSWWRIGGQKEQILANLQSRAKEREKNISRAHLAARSLGQSMRKLLTAAATALFN